MTAQCGASAMPWWACSAGGECVSLVNNSTRTNDTSTTILAAAAKCVCSAAYTGAVPLWIVPANAAIGDCHVHSLTHVILEWATLIACMLGFFYCLLRMLVGLPRGMRACCSSFVAASSLGFDCLPLYRIIVRLSSWCGSHRDTYSDESEQTRSTSTTNTRASGTRYRNNSNKKRISDALIADEFSPVQQQYFAARGISVHACLSLLLVGLFFLTAVCGSFDVIRVRRQTLIRTTENLFFILTICLFVYIYIHAVIVAVVICCRLVMLGRWHLRRDLLRRTYGSASSHGGIWSRLSTNATPNCQCQQQQQ